MVLYLVVVLYVSGGGVVVGGVISAGDVVVGCIVVGGGIVGGGVRMTFGGQVVKLLA